MSRKHKILLRHCREIQRWGVTRGVRRRKKLIECVEALMLHVDYSRMTAQQVKDYISKKVDEVGNFGQVHMRQAVSATEAMMQSLSEQGFVSSYQIQEDPAQNTVRVDYVVLQPLSSIRFTTKV